MGLWVKPAYFSLTLCFLLFGIVQRTAGTGHIEVHFLQYTDSCREDWGTNKCDPMFTFCLSRPQSGSPSVSKSKCQYGSTHESGHYHNTNNVDFERSTSIRGLKNPWVVQVQKFYDSEVMLVVRARDKDIISDDHLRTWGKTVTEIVWPTKEQSIWMERSMTSSDHTMHFRIRLYCDPYYYTHTCEKYCKAQDLDSGHYTCEPETGNKICMKGWQGENCDQDVNECELGFCVRGECSNFPGDYTCQCPENYQGKNCSEMIDPCRSDPCQNGADCYRHSSLHLYTCSCSDEWEGENCEIRKDPCDKVPCNNNGLCQSNEDNTSFNCICSYPYKGPRCEQMSTTTTTTTTTTSTSTTTTTPTPTTTTPTTTTSTTTSSTTTFKSIPPTIDPSSSVNAFSQDTAKTAGANSPSTTKETSTSESPIDSEANVEKFSQKDDGSDFQPWYFAIIGAILLILLILLAVFFIRRRKKKSADENLVSARNLVVSFNADGLAFENSAYAEANRVNAEIDEQQPASPRPLPSTPTEDELFNPVKPTYTEVDETCGAVGGCAPDDSDPKTKGKSATSGAKGGAAPFPSLSTSEETEVKQNPYADFNTLTRSSQLVQPDPVEDEEEIHYHDLDEIAMAMQDGADVTDADDSTQTGDDLTSSEPPTAEEGISTEPQAQDPPYNTPTNNQSYYASPPKRADDISDDSSDDEGHGTMQEDLYHLRKSVKDNLSSKA